MHRLDYELTSLCRRFRDGSFGTQAERLKSLKVFARELRDAGFKDMGARSIRREHVDALVKLWIQRGLGVGSIKNYLCALRWWARAVGKPKLIPPSNHSLGIPNRAVTPIHSKSKTIETQHLDRLPTPMMRISLRLQQEFGLRREESLKFRPNYADQGDYIRLKGSWTKGGKPRVIPILKPTQIATLAEAHEIAEDGSLIPRELKFGTYVSTFSKACARAGMNNMHGLRHGYAQRRYCDLAGFEVPLLGGPKRAKFTERQAMLDWLARITVSRELGHERIKVTNTYLGI